MTEENEIKNFDIAVRLGLIYLEDKKTEIKNEGGRELNESLVYRNYEVLEIIIEALGYGSYYDEYESIPNNIFKAICTMVEEKYVHQSLTIYIAESFINDLVEILERRSPYNITIPSIQNESCETIPF